MFQPRSATLLRDDAVAGDIVEDEDKENDPSTSDPTTMRRPPPFAVPSGPPPPIAVPPAIHHQATSSAMVPVNEVSDIVNAAIAGDPPRPSAAIKGGAAAAMASIADVVRRAVTDARREGASIGASETRLALQRSTAKAQESAAAAVRAAEESQRVAEEKARAAEERRKVLEIESNTKSKQLSKQLEEKQGDLGDKLKTLRARADAATNEATALRAELKREKEKNESIRNTAEKNDATEARFKALTVESKRAREEAKKLKFEMDSRVTFETKQVQRELANERARSAKELAWFQSEMREMTASCDAAVAAAREEAFSAAKTAAQETARLRAEFAECRELISRASSAVSARHRKALMTVMKKESWTRDEMEQLRNELEQERDARLKLKGAQFEKTSELDEALRTVQKLKVERDDADRAKVAAEAKSSLIDDAFRARDDAMSTAMSAKMEKDAADAAAKSAAQEVEAAWAAAATAEAEMAEDHKRALGEEGAKVYRVVRNDLRALRRRYFVRMGRDASGAEIDLEDCDLDNDGVDMGRVRKRLGIEGLVSAMVGFKRRGETDADAFGDVGLRKELRRMEECLLLTLTGDVENSANDESEETPARDVPQVCESPEAVKNKRSSRTAIADFKADRKAARERGGGNVKPERVEENVAEEQGRKGCMRELTSSDEDVLGLLAGVTLGR